MDHQDNDAPTSSNSPSHSNSRRRSSRSNLAQRLSRQLSRGFFPALRNLIRSRSERTNNSDVAEAGHHSEPDFIEPDVALPRLAPSSPEPPRTPFQRHTRVSPESLPEPSPPVLSSQGEPACTSPSPPADLNPLNNSFSPLLPSTVPFLPAPPAVPSPLLNQNVNDDSQESALSALNDLLNNASIPELPDGTTTSTTSSTSTSTTTNDPRQRYRLVVYFEERTAEEQPTARYVAVIVGRLDELQSLLSSSNPDRGFGDVLNHLFNAYAPKGTPPASADSISNLPTVTITEPEQPCMICLEHFAVGTEAVVLPCSHRFHGDECVKTWLKMHNSCPICRYELPVDDADYESNRKQRMMERGFHEDEAAASATSTTEPNSDEFFNNPDNMVD